MSISTIVLRLSGKGLGLGLALGALMAAPAMAQQMPATPDWEAPAEVKPAPKAKGAKATGTKAGAASARPTGGLNGPMRQVNREDIDMTGVGRDVGNFGTGVRPMMTGSGGMGVGGGF